MSNQSDIEAASMKAVRDLVALRYKQMYLSHMRADDILLDFCRLAGGEEVAKAFVSLRELQDFDYYGCPHQ